MGILLGTVGAESASDVGASYNFPDGPFSGLWLPGLPSNAAYDVDRMNGSEAISNTVKSRRPT